MANPQHIVALSPVSGTYICWEGENSKSCCLLAVGVLVLLLLSIQHHHARLGASRDSGVQPPQPPTMDRHCRGLNDRAGHCGSGYTVVQPIS